MATGFPAVRLLNRPDAARRAVRIKQAPANSKRSAYRGATSRRTRRGGPVSNCVRRLDNRPGRGAVRTTTPPPRRSDSHRARARTHPSAAPQFPTASASAAYPSANALPIRPDRRKSPLTSLDHPITDFPIPSLCMRYSVSGKEADAVAPYPRAFENSQPTSAPRAALLLPARPVLARPDP